MTANDDGEIIDAEIVETDSLPAVIPREAWSGERMEYEAKPGRTADGLSLDAASVARHDAALANNPERRCVATTPKGQCRKFAIMGSTVCKTHGGATKHIKSSARIRVENAQHKLIGKLIDFAFDDTKPPDVQLRAIRDALDRGGLKPPSEVVLSQGEPKPYEVIFDRIGGTPSDEFPSASAGYDPAGLGRGVADAGAAFAPTQPHPGDQTRSTDQAEPRENGDYTASSSWSEGSESFGDDPPRQRRPRESDDERQTQPGGRHITGGDAIRVASAMKAIESPHKGYRRP
jgi:hypothetical protein